MIKLLTFEKFNFKNPQQEDRYKPILDKIINAKVGDILSNDVVYMYVQYLCDQAGKYDNCFIDGDLGDRLDEYDNYILKEILIDKIDIEEWGFDMDDVEEYMKIYSKTKEYPPIVVSADYSIIDGTHRANALKHCGLKKILAFVGYNGVNESFNVDDPYDEEDWEDMDSIEKYYDAVREFTEKTIFPCKMYPITKFGPRFGGIKYFHFVVGNVKFVLKEYEYKSKFELILLAQGDDRRSSFSSRELESPNVSVILDAINSLITNKSNESVHEDDPYEEEIWEEDTIVHKYRDIVEKLGYKPSTIWNQEDVNPSSLFNFVSEYNDEIYTLFYIMKFRDNSIFLCHFNDDRSLDKIELFKPSEEFIKNAIIELKNIKKSKFIKKFEQFNIDDPYDEENWNEVEVNVKNFYELLVNDEPKIFTNIKYHINEEEFNNDELVEFETIYPNKGKLNFFITRIEDSGDHDFSGPGVYMILKQTGDSYKLIECGVGEIIDAVSDLAKKLKPKDFLWNWDDLDDPGHNIENKYKYEN